ncbi:MAG: hypothetical protein EXQ85_05680 [Alphaproteobacteria bacterium]|nr:hypothetical protein [Alphaproteobacteria bacterium]
MISLALIASVAAAPASAQTTACLDQVTTLERETDHVRDGKSAAQIRHHLGNAKTAFMRQKDQRCFDELAQAKEAARGLVPSMPKDVIAIRPGSGEALGPKPRSSRF